MFDNRFIRIPSALGAVLAATLMTVVSALPEAVHAKGTAKTVCVEKLPYAYQPTLQ